MIELIQGECLKKLQELPDKSVHCCVTSPPYWGLRDFGHPDQIGLEKTPEEFIAKIVAVFCEVHRVLRDDGTCWINMGDSYYGSWGNYGGGQRGAMDGIERQRKIISGSRVADRAWIGREREKPVTTYKHPVLKPKDMVGMPWRIAFALQAEGWYLRCDIIWSKPNPMPESVKDRPTKAHEYIFLLSKSSKYYYDHEAIKEPTTGNAHDRGKGVNPKAKTPEGWDTGDGNHGTIHKHGRGSMHQTRPRQSPSWSAAVKHSVNDRNKRSVWTIPTKAYPEAHFATFPPQLIEPCILAGCPEGGTVLDPFGGSGTTGKVAYCLGRNAILIELIPEYHQMAGKRIDAVRGELFND